MKNKPLLIFDLDGTLVDSKQDIVNSLNTVLAEQGFSTLAPELIESFVGRGMMQLIQDALGNPTPNQMKRVTRAFIKHYGSHLLDATRLYPGTLEILERFSLFPKAVVTNKPYQFTTQILKGLAIDSYFQWVVGGDSLPVQKPSALVFEPILKDFSQKPLGYMIGDSEIDIASGRQAGFTTIAVSFGFRSRDELQKSAPDYLIDDWDELEAIVCS